MTAYPWHQASLDALLKRKERLPHALLLRGTQGIGKLALAETLAQALLCEHPARDYRACGKCAACGWMEQRSHPDLRRLEPEALGETPEAEEGRDRKASQEIRVEQVRAVADFVNVTSHRGGAKIVLIHPAEALNVNAANALLKSLEEPPPRTYFLLVAHRWHQLLATVKSRCQHVALPPPPAAMARDWLRQQGLHEPELALAQAGGAPLLAGRFDEEYWRQRGQFLKAIADRSFDPLGTAERLRDLEPAPLVAWMQKWSFDLAWHKVTGEVRYNPDFAAGIAHIAGGLDLLEALRFHRQMVRLQRTVSHPLNARLFLEQLLLTYAAFVRRGRQPLAA
jgi:DNA polymerase-3 subunit delta'